MLLRAIGHRGHGTAVLRARLDGLSVGTATHLFGETQPVGATSGARIGGATLAGIAEDPDLAIAGGCAHDDGETAGIAPRFARFAHVFDADAAGAELAVRAIGVVGALRRLRGSRRGPASPRVRTAGSRVVDAR